MRFSRQKYWSGVPSPTLRQLWLSGGLISSRAGEGTAPPKFLIVVSGLHSNPAGFILIGHFIFPPVFQMKLTYNIFTNGGGHDDLIYVCTGKGLPVWLTGHFKWVAVHTINHPKWEPYFCVFIVYFLPKHAIVFFLPRGPQQGKCLVQTTGPPGNSLMLRGFFWHGYQFSFNYLFTTFPHLTYIWLHFPKLLVTLLGGETRLGKPHAGAFVFFSRPSPNGFLTSLSLSGWCSAVVSTPDPDSFLRFQAVSVPVRRRPHAVRSWSEDGGLRAVCHSRAPKSWGQSEQLWPCCGALSSWISS